jgi:hypothetical protein
MSCFCALGGVAEAKIGQRHYAVGVSAATLTLDFHGDQATGCAQHGLCDTSGTITATFAAGHAGFAGLETFFDTLTGTVLTPDRITGESVIRTPGAPDCTDSTQAGFVMFSAAMRKHGAWAVGYDSSAFDALSHGGEFNVGSSGGDDVFASRCAGPEATDYAAALPLVRLPRQTLLHKRFTVDLSGVRSFAAGGFAGTLTATNLKLSFRRGACHGAKARRACTAFDDFV